ncbi:MAG: hypothetical protein ACJAZO_000858 [Myxococcota bacterium]|jgi:hypothetical protein
MVTTTSQQTAGTSGTAVKGSDPLQDPLTASPVDGPARKVNIRPEDIMRVMSPIATLGAQPSRKYLASIVPVVQDRIQDAHIRWTKVDIELNAGIINNITALREYSHLSTQLHMALGLLPSGLHPDIDALKASASAGIKDYRQRYMAIERAQMLKRRAAEEVQATQKQAARDAEDLESVNALHDSLMNADDTR